MSAAQEALDQFDPEIAWEPYFPNRVNRWDAVKIAHLYRRAAMGASWEQIRAAADSTPDAIVSRLFEESRDTERFERDMARVEEGVLDSNEPRQLKAAWIYRMLHSLHPLRERLTLFWHNHFATSNAKVNDVRLMQRQNNILRRHALGYFGEMLQEITLDPAMLVWLDSNTNKKGQPNENYAREIFELFSLGVGNYTENDIKEAARALTGWEMQGGRPRFDPAQHDRTDKDILGRAGAWGAGDVVRIALAQPACARFLVRKLFRELVSETADPSDKMLAPLVEGFRLRNYDIGWLVDRMLQSWVFYSPASIHQRIKSPVEFVVGTVRALEGRAGPLELADLCDRLGQSLFYPPSVKGWDGGSAWMNSTTLLHRQNFAFDITRGTGNAAACDPARLAEKYDISGPEALARFFLDLFHQQPDHHALPDIVAHLEIEQKQRQREFYSQPAVNGLLARTAAHLVMTLPEYQLA